MGTWIRAALALGAIVCGSVLGQEESRPAAPRPDTTGLEKAMAALLDQKGFRLTGDAVELHAEDEGGGGAHVMVMGAGAGATRFTGGIEVVRTPKAELLIVSKSRLPGFAALDNGERFVATTTFETEPIDVSVVVGDLTAVLDLDELLKAIRTSSTLESKPDEAAGGSRWTFQLPKRLVKGWDDGPLAFARPRVKALKATVALGKDATVTSLTISITRTDPMARVRRRAMEQVREGGAAQIGAEDMGGDEDGATSRYTLKPAPGEPSPRAKDALAHLQRALSDG